MISRNPELFKSQQCKPCLCGWIIIREIMAVRLLRCLGLAAGLLTAAACTPGAPMSPQEQQQASQLYQAHDWQGLSTLAKHAAFRNSSDGFAWYYAGLADDGLGHRSDAIKEYEEAMRNIPAYLQGSVVQLLAQDDAALDRRDSLIALCKKLDKTNPEIARSLRNQFPAILATAAPPVTLPDISPRSLDQLTANVRRTWRSDAVAMTVQFNPPQTVYDFYSPSTRTGLAIVSSASGATNLPADNPNWGTVPIPANFLPLATALQRVPNSPPASAIEHAFLFRRSGNPADPSDLIWSIAVKGAAFGASEIPAGIMSKEELDRLQAAASGGDPKAEYSLALAYASGVAGSPDPKNAVAWLTRAAQHGNVQAENKLGQFCQYGIGIPVNATYAAGWYRRAANAHFAPAEYNLGLLYETGLGVPQDWIQADQWITAAARQGLQSAYMEMTGVRNAARREQHRQEVAAAQQRTSGRGCQTRPCPMNMAIMQHMMSVAVHPELPPNRLP